MSQRKKTFNWIPGIFLITYHSVLVLALPIYLLYFSPSWSLLVISGVLLYMTGLSITAGYHRFYAHRSFRTNRAVETVMLFLGSMATQGSALRWAYEHRLHHAYTDTDKDPHSIKRGFWYAHFLWLFEKPGPIQPSVVSDLKRNPLVMFQDRHLLACITITNVAVVAAVGWLVGDMWGAFVFAGLARMFLLHHFTWFINSLAHTWGARYFCQELTAVDNYILSFLTFGEGYHNYHHAYANDYRNGVRWYHFDPTKWLIWTLSKLGLATDLRRTDPLTVQKRIIQERKTLLLDRIQELWYVKAEELEAQIEEMAARITGHLQTLRQLSERYQQFKLERASKDLISQVYQEICDVKKGIKDDWNRWCRLSKHILHMKPLSV